VKKLKTLSPHLDAVDAPCQYASYCGGCKTQNLSYEAQIRFKEQQVRELMVHVGKFPDGHPEVGSSVKPIVPCANQFHYRNKVRMKLCAYLFSSVGCMACYGIELHFNYQTFVLLMPSLLHTPPQKKKMEQSDKLKMTQRFLFYAYISTMAFLLVNVWLSTFKPF